MLTSATVSVTQRLGDSWDVGGSFGPSHLSYRQALLTTGQQPRQIPDETVAATGIDIGYNIKHTRLGVYAEHIERDSEVARGYQRYRFGSTVKYEF